MSARLIVAVLALAVAVQAAYKPGWTPPACLGEKFRPTNISIENDTEATISGPHGTKTISSTKFYVFNKTSGKMDKFFVRGVGYSPIFPSKYTYSQAFDMFTSEYRYIWERDLIRIKEMGANTVRVWSWDSFRDHTDFLDTMYENGLFLMVPFQFTRKMYKDLSDPGTRKQALVDFKAFVLSVRNHPAVLAYLIGNELNTNFGAQRQELFGLINNMVKIRDDIDDARHPITLPLSDVAFVESYSNPFYQWSGIDFWSLQTYRPQMSIQKPIMDYYYSYAVNMSRLNLPYKPLVLTEFGVDALSEKNNTGTWGPGEFPPQPPESQYKQALFFCQMFSAARDNREIGTFKKIGTYSSTMTIAQVIGGMIIMEWNDEWWKGMYGDASAPLCPNYRTEMHSWCSQDVGTEHSPYYLHEEWLGITSQVYDPKLRNLCLCPREAYHMMKIAFECNGDEACLPKTTPTGSDPFDGFGCAPEWKEHYESCGTSWCAHRRSIFLNPYISMLVPVFLISTILFVISIYLYKSGIKQAEAEEEAKKISRQSLTDGGAIGDGTYKQEESTTSTNGSKLRTNITHAFLKYCNVGTTESDSNFCPYFVAAQERLFTLVWDKYTALDTVSEDLMTGCTGIVYEQFMEAYHLYTGEPPRPSSDRQDMFDDMALYSIVQAWAGTINHSPEKICEVFEFSKDYFANAVSRNHGALRAAQVQDFHHGLVEIFRSYYLKVDEGEFTFEDVNTDALHYREKRNTKSGAEAKTHFWDDVQTNKQEDDGVGVDTKAQRTRASLEKVTGKDCPELDLLPEPELRRDEESAANKLHPFLEYHKMKDSEEHGNLLSDASKTFFLLHDTLCGVRWMKPDDKFPQRGGPFTLLFNYGWVVRYLLWQNVIAIYLQPISVAAPMCLCDAVKWLALIDACWCFFSALLHRRIIGRMTKRIMLELVVYAVGLAAVIMANIVPALDGTTDSNKTDMSTAYGFGWSINTFYLIGTLAFTILDETRLLMKSHAATYPIPARFVDNRLVLRVRVVYYTVLVILLLVLNAVWIPNLGGSGSSIMDVLNSKIDIPFWPDFVKNLWVLILIVVCTLVPYFTARFIAAGASREGKAAKKAKEEATFLVANAVFWGAFWVINWYLAYEIFVPSVRNITFNLCECQHGNPNLTEVQVTLCEPSFSFTCYIAVVFTWLSAFLITFVALFGSFEIMLLIFGLARAKYNRVGNIKTWADVDANFDQIMEKSVTRMSTALEYREKANETWNVFVRALYEDSLLSIVERDRLLTSDKQPRPNFRLKPRSEEAIRRITYHLWSLESVMAHDEINPDQHSQMRKAHRVRTMPTLSVVIPAYNETIVFEEDQLIKTRTPGKQNMRITEIEYLVHTYPDEWDNLAEKLKAVDKSWVVAEDNFAMDLLQSYLSAPGHPRLDEQTRFEIRWWATMRGQTLARTMQGFINWRTALVSLLKLEEDGIPDDEAQRIVSRKFQLVVSHQTYNAANDIMKTPVMPHEEAMEICFRRLKYFDLVFNDDKNFQSVCKRLKFEALLTSDGRDELKYSKKIQLKDEKTGKTHDRHLFNFFPKEAFEIQSIQRVGRLKIGEGKAENQMHALQFVNGMVLQAIDMNQAATTENGFKVPYLLGDYFNTNISMTEGSNADQSAIPRFRIVGFPEWAYTRSLSLVGELMGAAEWCFVTITQRVLDWPLRIRLHYGHPDFFDCFYVRNRGGQSKASQLVNTNEDIFAGYEMLGRGDRGSFVEFIECQKGRETSFGGAFTFEAKLAMGGAQQTRSFDVYKLNRGLDIFGRFSLFFTSLAFYITNLLMAVSINYYILSLALFAVSGVTYHKLGLLNAVIAVPWLFQIGYVLAFPYLVELMIQRGVWRGLGQFIKTLPPSILFFIFHLRTKTYFFLQGLLIGKGGYAGTGRGFGLDRSTFKEMYKAYSESHYHEGLLISAVLLVYAVYGSDPAGTYLLRTFNIILIVISWFWAPILFNPAPTTQDLQNDTKEVLDWISNERKDAKNLDLMLEKLDSVHLMRVQGLVTNLEAEIKEYLRTAEDDLNDAMSVREGGNPAGDAFSDAGMSTYKGMPQTLMTIQESEDRKEALKRAYTILSKTRTQLSKTQLADNAKATTTLDQVMKECWGSTSEESWAGWYVQAVVMMAWEGEDTFFPGIINLVLQKIYLVFLTYAPWILLCIDKYHIDSVWFLVLFGASAITMYGVDKAFARHHEYTAIAKGSLILCAPTAFLFFHFSLMGIDELFWSMTLYIICISLCIRGVFGVINARAKFRRFGISGNPNRKTFEATRCESDNPMKEELLRVSIRNRTAEMDAANRNEQQRFALFMDRMQHIKNIITFRGIIPLLCTLVLAIGNTLTVIIGEWVTTLNFNGRVNEAWKKAYLRPSVTTKDDPEPGAFGAARPLNRNAEQAMDESAATAAAVYGSLSSSLPAHRRHMRAPTSRNMLSTNRLPMAAPQSNRTLMSVGSFASTTKLEDDASVPIMREGQSESYGSLHQASSAQQRNAMHFLNNLTDKYRQK